MNFDQVNITVKSNPDYIKREVTLQMNILDRINYLLIKIFDGKQAKLARAMNKSESEISKWFTGYQNFTISTLAKLEAAFGEDIIHICADQDEDCVNYVFVKHKTEEALTLAISNGGEFEFVPVEPK